MILLKRATAADATTLTELGKSTFSETFAKDNRPEDMALYLTQTFSVERQRAEIQDPLRKIEIAWVGDSPAGYLHLLIGAADPSVTGPKSIEILRLYVDSQWHGKGVGAALMDRAIALAREEGFQTLWLGVWERNFRAQAFYRKFGFNVVGSHGFRLGTDDQTDLILMRNV